MYVYTSTTLSSSESKLNFPEKYFKLCVFLLIKELISWLHACIRVLCAAHQQQRRVYTPAHQFVFSLTTKHTGAF